MGKKVILCLLVGSLGLFTMDLGRPSAQEAFPTKPITMLVPFPPGGLSDTTARSYAGAVQKLTGQPMVVVNKPGAGGTISVDALHAAKPDGYMLLESSASTLAHGMYTQGVNWGPKDFTVILGHSLYNFAFVVRADAPWKNFEEWVQYVRQNPPFKYGCYGHMVTMHVVMEWVGKRLGLKLVPVHLKGDAEGIQNLLGGHTMAHCFAGGQDALIKAGKLKTLLQVTGEPSDANPKAVSRLKDALPDAPLDIVALPRGIFGPKGMPEPILKSLEEAFNKAATSKNFISFAEQLLLIPKYKDRGTTKRTVETEYKAWSEITNELGIKAK